MTGKGWWLTIVNRGTPAFGFESFAWTNPCPKGGPTTYAELGPCGTDRCPCREGHTADTNNPSKPSDGE